MNKKKGGLAASGSSNGLTVDLDESLDGELLELSIETKEWYCRIEFNDINTISELKSFFESANNKKKADSFKFDSTKGYCTFRKDDEFEDRYFIDFDIDGNFVKLTLFDTGAMLHCLNEICRLKM